MQNVLEEISEAWFHEKYVNIYCAHIHIYIQTHIHTYICIYILI